MKNASGKAGLMGTIVTALCAFTALFHIVTSYVGALDMMRHRSLHLTLMMTACFLVAATKEKGSRKGINIVLAAVTMVCGLYVFNEGVNMPLRAGSPTAVDMVIGALFLALAIEATRRTAGTAMAIIALFFIFYTRFGEIFPGFLRHAPYSFKQIINDQFIEMSGLWGVPLGMAATFIIIFVIFGDLMNEAGITEVFMELANKLMGQTIGATAKIATMISVLVGSITGSAAASVMVTGAMTITGMRKTGYSPTFIAAVQAIGGTGGQIMPPIMGSAAFVIAAFLGIPYIAVCKAALLPALLFYFCLFMVVHYETKRVGIKALSREEVSEISWLQILKKAYLFVPLIILTYLLFMGYSPMYAGFIGVVLLLIAGRIRKGSKFTPAMVFAALERSVVSAIPVTMSCAAAGIIVGCIMQSGLGYTLSASLVRISGGRPYMLAFLVMVACMILGMGMTTVGAYIIVASLVAPALTQIGIKPIAAHLFPFFYAILSAITPPVAVAVYAAAGLTQTNPWKVGLLSVYFSIPIFIIPFVFFSQPELLMIGNLPSILVTTGSCVLGIMAFAAGVTGYYLRHAPVIHRVALVAGSAGLFMPQWSLKAAGLAIMVVVAALEWKDRGQPGNPELVGKAGCA
ncbi:MAG: TRAP transporter permease [Ignavibacteriales bacterium]